MADVMKTNGGSIDMPGMPTTFSETSRLSKKLSKKNRKLAKNLKKKTSKRGKKKSKLSKKMKKLGKKTKKFGKKTAKKLGKGLTVMGVVRPAAYMKENRPNGLLETLSMTTTATTTPKQMTLSPELMNDLENINRYLERIVLHHSNAQLLEGPNEV